MLITKNADHVLRVERTTKLGALGEQIAAERIADAGFTDIQNLNETAKHNFPFADLTAKSGTQRFLIGVKTRNEYRADGKLNESYNAVLIRDSVNRQLKEQGWSQARITEMLLKGIQRLANEWNAIPAWVAVAVRPEISTYSAYFGTMSQLGLRRSIPMTPDARKLYKALAEQQYDPRILPALLNR